MRTATFQGPLSRRRMCRLSGVPRASFERRPEPESEWARSARQALREVALECPAYGYRRVLAELQRRGWQIGERRVRRWMREAGLSRRRQRAWKRTTDSKHSLTVYPNLARTLTLSAPDQLWAADITYVRLLREFVYAAVILDVFSRRAVGWAVGPTLHTELPLAALEQALSQRQPEPGLVHHSDRGSQYASQLYVQRLKDHQIVISMSRKGNPYDNAFAESFIKTLKVEEVYCNEYETLQQAQADIGHFLEFIYNGKRLHSALGYRPPEEFEAAFAAEQAAAASSAAAQVSGARPVGDALAVGDALRV